MLFIKLIINNYGYWKTFAKWNLLCWWVRTDIFYIWHVLQSLHWIRYIFTCQRFTFMHCCWNFEMYQELFWIQIMILWIKIESCCEEAINSQHSCKHTYFRSRFIRATTLLSCFAHITFTFMHLADAFIQSDLQYIQAIHFFYQYVCSLGIEPMTFCAANAMLYHWATGTLFYFLHKSSDKADDWCLFLQIRFGVALC